MKLIFLDVDGVLNRGNTPGKFEAECLDALKHVISKSDAKVVLSSTWRYTEETTGELLAKLREVGIFSEEDDFIGHTSHLGKLENVAFYPTCDSHVTRTDEILLWIKCNTVPVDCTRENFMDESNEASYNPLPSEVSNTAELFQKGEEWSMTGNWILDEPIVLEQFVVIDDLPMLSEGCYGKCLKGHFVHTSMKTGLTMELANDAVKILNSKFNFKKWRKNVFKACSNPNCLLNPKDEEITDDKGKEKKPNAPDCVIA